MSNNPINDIAAIIREVDGGNRLDIYELGWKVQERLDSQRSPRKPLGADLVLFLARTNPDKKMGAGRLAELIVAEFDLDEEV
jgi:hypothetical protein